MTLKRLQSTLRRYIVTVLVTAIVATVLFIKFVPGQRKTPSRILRKDLESLRRPYMVVSTQGNKGLPFTDESANTFDIEKLESTNNIDIKNIETTNKFDMENIESTKKVDFRNIETTNKFDMENIESTNKLNIQSIESAKSIDIDNNEQHSGQLIPRTTISTTHNKPKPSSVNVKERFDQRMKFALSVCNRSNYSSIKSYQIWDSFAFGRLTYCSLPKAGTTYLNRDLTPNLRLINNGESQNTFRINDRKRFFVVREPYSRLVSAFFSKIVGLPFWWDMAGGTIIKNFRQNASELSIKCGHDVTFPEYIKFVIEMHKTRLQANPHFLRIMEVCNICADVPDYITKLETIKEDVEYILNSVNVTGILNSSFVEVRHLAKLFMKYHTQRNARKETGCEKIACKVLDRYWYGQQATGLISEEIELPVKGRDCDKMTGDKLADLAGSAYEKSIGLINKHVYKQTVMRRLFSQVPMGDRKEIQRLLSLECELFGYDPQPDFVFPEYSQL